MLIPHAQAISALTDLYLDHRFSLLGSDWVEVKHGTQCFGLEGRRYPPPSTVSADGRGEWLVGRINKVNLDESRRIWNLIEGAYTPIDWQLDFKSGFRWSEGAWCRRIRQVDLPGADVKVPWELARMQHLPMLASAYALSCEGLEGFREPETCVREFRNEVLDFIATNPPRFGVNWACTMEVAIRAANWLMAYDLFACCGAEFDCGFEEIFLRSIYEHGKHIVGNLEWNGGERNNHYLAGLVGLLFAAAYLNGSAEADGWLAFAMHELIGEVQHQFNPEGTNFEASTCYHRLAAEMVFYGTALVLGLPASRLEALAAMDLSRLRYRPNFEPSDLKLRPNGATGSLSLFPEWYVERLERMAEFTIDVTRPDGSVPQIGDNDSGRFFKITPLFMKVSREEALNRFKNLEGCADHRRDDFWLEDYLDHRHLVAAANGLFDREDFAEFAGGESFETELVRHLDGGSTLPRAGTNHSEAKTKPLHLHGEITIENMVSRFEDMSEEHKQFIRIDAPGSDLLAGLKVVSYSEFGLYLFRSKRLYLAVRCGPIGQYGKGGHAHNDPLSTELSIDGKVQIADPGTYLYAPLPERRNEYRSVRAHFAPQVESVEPGRLDRGLFRLGDEAKAQCLFFGESGFVGRYSIAGRFVYRILLLLNNAVLFYDFSESLPLKKLDIRGIREGRCYTGNVPFSPGYGIQAVDE